MTSTKITKSVMEKISLEKAKTLALLGQGLLIPAKSKTSALSVIEHLGYVQIDTLSVVARAHHHTLWSRVPTYKESTLNKLLEKDKAIFEYWSHAASYLPMSDFRYSLPRKQSYIEGKSHWFTQDKKIKKYVLDKIKSEGPLQSKDFEYKRTGPGNWFEWKPAKRALEQLFMEGELMIAKRQGFQKVYDLSENVLPDHVDRSMPTNREYAENLIRKAILANGIVEAKEIFHLRPDLKESINKAVKGLIKDGELLEVQIEGLEKTPYVTSAHQLKLSEKKLVKDSLHILSPFDNSVIQRKRVQNLFDFDYTIECYVPEPKRKYGYFCLPVLYGNSFVARFDPKADRASKTFYIKAIYFEEGFTPSTDFNILFAKKLKEFALFNGCEKIVIDCADKKWKKEILVASALP
jgi:uncharacterized protein YcaQ